MPDDTAMTIKDMLESRARLYADHVALLATNRPPLTYRALLDHTHRIAAQLKQARICHKDRIAVVLPDNADLISYVFRYIRYSLVGFWVSAGAPWLFFRFKLAQSQM